ncbi:MAG: hypothetical protein Fur0034_18310 [Desulfuromonadia bacterium]
MLTEFNEDPGLCRVCGGECCRTLPGFDAPDRFLASGDPAGMLARILGSGEWVLSPHPWRMEDGQWVTIRYPRPATRQEFSAGTIDAIGPGVCHFLTDQGCRLTFSDRPTLCRLLTPSPSGECSSPWTKRDAAIAWLPHQDLVERVLAILSPSRLTT